jgi:uncharacterized membrane protein YhaH (DUF805 family)
MIDLDILIGIAGVVLLLINVTIIVRRLVDKFGR